MTVTNLNQFKYHKKQSFIKCIKNQIISDYKLTPRDLTPDVVEVIDEFSQQIYEFDSFIRQKKPLN